MKAILTLAAFQLFELCAPPALDRIVYKPHNYSPKAIVYLPKGYTLERILAEGDTEYLFKYSDSSFFYISSFATPHSYKEIRKINAFYSKEKAFRSKQELMLSGKDSLGLFWRDRTIKGLSVGYYKVHASQLSVMEEAMKTLCVK